MTFDPDRIYIAGPMSGIPDYNRPAFLTAERLLTSVGYSVWNPARNGLPLDAPWDQHMRTDIAVLMTCGRLALLPGWQRSKGAGIEHDLAVSVGCDIRTVFRWLEAAERSAA